MVSEHLKGNSRAQVVDFDGAGLVQADGSISHHDMYDYLHLTQKGYEKAFEQVREIVKEKPKTSVMVYESLPTNLSLSISEAEVYMKTRWG